MAQRLNGQILLQVEENGEAWYVDKINLERHYLGKPGDAFLLMQNFGKGISDADISKIPVGILNQNNCAKSANDNDGDCLPNKMEIALGTDPDKADTDEDGYKDPDEIINNYNPNGQGNLPVDKQLAANHAGNILIQAEKNGEAWYVNPENNKRYFLGRPADAFDIMRKLGLGVSNQNLSRIPEHKNTNQKNIVTSPADDDTQKYYDNDNNFSLAYPSEWRIKGNSEKDDMVYLGDYKENLFKENRAVLKVMSINTSGEESLDDFKIKEKEKAHQTLSEKLNINDFEALQEEFRHYNEYDSFEINTTIKRAKGEYVHISLTAGGNKDYYIDIYNKIINSIEFTD